MRCVSRPAAIRSSPMSTVRNSRASGAGPREGRRDRVLGAVGESEPRQLEIPQPEGDRARQLAGRTAAQPEAASPSRPRAGHAARTNEDAGRRRRGCSSTSATSSWSWPPRVTSLGSRSVRRRDGSTWRSRHIAWVAGDAPAARRPCRRSTRASSRKCCGASCACATQSCPRGASGRCSGAAGDNLYARRGSGRHDRTSVRTDVATCRAVATSAAARA